MRDQQEASCRVVLDLLAERTEEIGRRISELQCMEDELRELHRAVCSVSMGKHHCNSKQREASAKGKGKS